MIRLFSSCFIIPIAITSAVFGSNFKLDSKPTMETLSSWGCTKPWRILSETLLIWLHIGNYSESHKPNLNSFNLCLSHQEQLTCGLPGVLLNGLGFFFSFQDWCHYSLFSRNEIHESTDISAGAPKSHSGSLHIWWEITQHFRTMNASFFIQSNSQKVKKKKSERITFNFHTFLLANTFHFQLPYRTQIKPFSFFSICFIIYMTFSGVGDHSRNKA